MDKSYVFAGSRGYVLKEMIRKGLNIKAVWVMNGTFLHNVLLEDPFIDYTVIYDKKQLLDEIEKTEFDVLISNGCSYILPVSKLKPAAYINLHPSPLPDLKGKNPINAAFLYDRPCGATCHVMDDGIDTGKVISQVVIPMTGDLEAAILYRLCFNAEVIAFDAALKRDFKILECQPTVEGPIYYSAKPEDWMIRFENGPDYILRQIRAFGYKGKGLYFKYGNELHRFFRGSEVSNPYVLKCYEGLSDLQVAMVFDDSVIFRIGDRMLRFDQVENAACIKEGAFLEPAMGEIAPGVGTSTPAK